MSIVFAMCACVQVLCLLSVVQQLGACVYKQYTILTEPPLWMLSTFVYACDFFVVLSFGCAVLI